MDRLNAPTQVAAALATVYLVWGSTYLGIRIAVQGIPPALCAGLRFDIAGVLMLTYALARGHRLPASVRDWRDVVLTGALLLIGGNGLVTWAEVWIQSNLAALIVATAALWIAGLGTLGAKGEKLNARSVAGLLLGFAGVAALVGGGIERRDAPPLAYLALLAAPLSWALGSVYAKRNPVSCHYLITVALQMLVAGVAMTVMGLLSGEAAALRWQWHSVLALAYLIVFGSCIAYAAYVWLVHQVTPALLGTYAYVNPAVAVLLGWWLLGERLTALQLAGTAIILIGVVLVTLASLRRPQTRS